MPASGVARANQHDEEEHHTTKQIDGEESRGEVGKASRIRCDLHRPLDVVSPSGYR
jgi:hypothetical protein